MGPSDGGPGSNGSGGDGTGGAAVSISCVIRRLLDNAPLLARLRPFRFLPLAATADTAQPPTGGRHKTAAIPGIHQGMQKGMKSKSVRGLHLPAVVVFEDVVVVTFEVEVEVEVAVVVVVVAVVDVDVGGGDGGGAKCGGDGSCKMAPRS